MDRQKEEIDLNAPNVGDGVSDAVSEKKRSGKERRVGNDNLLEGTERRTISERRKE